MHAYAIFYHIIKCMFLWLPNQRGSHRGATNYQTNTSNESNIKHNNRFVDLSFFVFIVFIISFFYFFQIIIVVFFIFSHFFLLLLLLFLLFFVVIHCLTCLNRKH